MKKAPKRSSESKRGPFVMAPLRQELEEELQVLAGEKLRPVVTHLVRPLEPLGGNRLHEKERPSETKRLPALVERAACLSRLDDHGCVGKERHGAVSHGKVLAPGWVSGRKLRDREVVPHDQVLERAILRRKSLVERRTENGDRLSSGLDCGLMRGGVDPFCEPAHDDNVALYELESQGACPYEPVSGRLPGANNGNTPTSRERGVTGNEEHRRGVLLLHLVERPQKLFGSELFEDHPAPHEYSFSSSPSWPVAGSLDAPGRRAHDTREGT